MEIDEDPFPPVALVNITSFDLRTLIESKKKGKLSPRKVWVPNLNSPPSPKLELNIVLNVKQKQEWILSTPLRLIKSPKFAPMNMTRIGGKGVKSD